MERARELRPSGQRGPISFSRVAVSQGFIWSNLAAFGRSKGPAEVETQTVAGDCRPPVIEPGTIDDGTEVNRIAPRRQAEPVFQPFEQWRHRPTLVT